MADNFKMGELFDDVAIAWKHDPHVGPATERPGERRRDGSQSAHPDEVIHFRRNKEDFQKSTLSKATEVTPVMQERFQFFLQSDKGHLLDAARAGRCGLSEY
jgi:hypothetical protein